LAGLLRRHGTRRTHALVAPGPAQLSRAGTAQARPFSGVVAAWPPAAGELARNKVRFMALHGPEPDLVLVRHQAGHTTGNRGWSISAPAGSSASRSPKGGEVRQARGACRTSADR